MTCRESGLLARESEIRSAEAERLGLGALGVVPAVDRRRKDPACQLSDRSAGAVFVRNPRPERAAPPEAVSVGWVETDGSVSRGVRRRGNAPPHCLGGSRGLLPPTVLPVSHPRRERAEGSASWLSKLEPRPFPGTPLPNFAPRQPPRVCPLAVADAPL